jgi:competence protein ComEA
MTSLSRGQIALYGAVAIALLLVGARWIRAEPSHEARAATGDNPIPFRVSGQPDSSGDVVVHVAGEVRRPGVYRLPAGSRVTDAIERADGPTADAATDAVNLAARLADGQQVIVPARGPAGAAVTAGAAAGPISLGTATVDQLDEIEGIGPVTAQKIVDYRTQHGGIASVEELDRIGGIGPATMEALKSRLQP